MLVVFSSGERENDSRMVEKSFAYGVKINIKELDSNNFFDRKITLLWLAEQTDLMSVVLLDYSVHKGVRTLSLFLSHKINDLWR